ncbi:MAG: hypothetical protein WBA59_03785 [Moheibacter sp.]
MKKENNELVGYMSEVPGFIKNIWEFNENQKNLLDGATLTNLVYGRICDVFESNGMYFGDEFAEINQDLCFVMTFSKLRNDGKSSDVNLLLKQTNPKFESFMDMIRVAKDHLA